MANLTRAKVAYNLHESPHIHKVFYGGNEMTYVFSSEYYKNKFVDNREDFKNKISESLTKRFGFAIVNELLSDIKLYSTIEKRGFLIFHNKEVIECLDNITLDGKSLIVKV